MNVPDLQKPDQPITSHPSYDYDLGDRVARALEHSPLHVVGASVVVSLPESRQAAVVEEMFGLNPPPFAVGGWLTEVELVFVTDGAHGWLALVDATDDDDAEAEVSKLMAEILVGHEEVACVVRAVSDFGALVAGALDLREPATRRARIEAEYARLLGDSAATAPEDFFARFRGYEHCVRGEAEIRETMNESPEESPAPRPSPPPPKAEGQARRPRAGRRGIGSRRARRRRSRRPRKR